MPIKGKKESKQRAIKAPQASGNTTARGALGASVTPTPELGRIIGTSPLTRGDAMRKLWDYIKKHGRDALSMFEMTAYVSRHLNKQ